MRDVAELLTRPVRRAEFAQRHHVVDGTKSREGQCEIQAWSLVTGELDDAVALRPGRIPRVVVGGMEIKRGGNIHHRERPTGVSRTRRAQSDQIVPAHQVGGRPAVVRWNNPELPSRWWNP
jgi:hypothetical protein